MHVARVYFLLNNPKYISPIDGKFTLLLIPKYSRSDEISYVSPTCLSSTRHTCGDDESFCSCPESQPVCGVLHPTQHRFVLSVLLDVVFPHTLCVESSRCRTSNIASFPLCCVAALLPNISCVESSRCLTSSIASFPL